MPNRQDEVPIERGTAHPAPVSVAVPTKARPSAVQALSQAWDDTLEFLFKPLDVDRWFWLSFICLFLGGRAASAAFSWSFSSLPGNVGFDRIVGPLHDYVSRHLWLITLAVALGLGFGLALLYVRALFRFVLVDALVRRAVRLRTAWTETRPLGRSYFSWLLGTLLLVGASLTSGAIAAIPHLRSLSLAGTRSLLFWVILAGLILVDILVGLLLAVVVILTDDLVVPIMYAEGLALLPAWKKLWQSVRAEVGGFAVYVLLRFAVGVAVGAGALFFLFPILVGLFSGAIMTGVSVLLGVRLLGLSWAWNPLTTSLALAALLLLIVAILIVLSVVGMPGQLLIQNFGIRFMSARAPALKALLDSERQAGEGAGLEVYETGKKPWKRTPKGVRQPGGATDLGPRGRADLEVCEAGKKSRNTCRGGKLCASPEARPTLAEAVRVVPFGNPGPGVRITHSMRSSVRTSACCLALLMSGCAKRQSGARLVYVASPPAVTSAVPTQESGTLVIEEPATPEPQELPAAAPLPAPAPKAAPQSKPRRSSTQTGLAEPVAEEPPVELPPLEPAKSPGQGRRQQLEKTQRDMRSSIEQFERSRLSNPERRTLAEAQGFLDQSTRALKEGDLPRAEKLADKARLLITALEQRH